MANSKPHIRKATIRPKKEDREYFVWCDESNARGRYCSNFYGGVLVKSEDLHEVQTTLQRVCRQLHFFDEIKWNKVSQQYLEKYQKAMDAFFKLVAEDKIKVRIMYTQNGSVATAFKRHRTEAFYLLYYQFLKHAFGLPYSNNGEEDIYLRLYFDCLPYSKERRKVFKDGLNTLQQSQPFQLARLKVRKQDITEVDSKKHLLLQLLDVVLGCMCFQLNNGHPAIPEVQKSKRAIAKEMLYQHIHEKLREIRPGFTIGAHTGISNTEDQWAHPYRHWVWNDE